MSPDKLSFVRDARGGPHYHAVAIINQKEISYTIFGIGSYWYLHMADESALRHFMFGTKREAVAFAKDDFEFRKTSKNSLTRSPGLGILEKYQ